MPFPSATLYPSASTYPGAASALSEVVPMPPGVENLHAEVEDANGRRALWDGNARDPADRPQDLSYRTQRGDGFADASVTLRRRADQDFPDLSLLRKLRLVDDTGYIAYEGLITEFPREVGPDGHSIVVNAAGLMTSARFRKFREIYIDRDVTRWGPLSSGGKITVAAFNGRPSNPNVINDVQTGLPGLEMRNDSAAPAAPFPHLFAQYDAGAGLTIGSFYFSGKIISGFSAVSTSWTNASRLETKDDLSGTVDEVSSNPQGATRQGTLTAGGTDRRFAGVRIFRPDADAGTGHAYIWTCLAVYGNHGLTKQGSEGAGFAKGLNVSDMIADICNRFCPMLSSAGVQPTTYPVQQAVYRDDTEPYEAFQDLNRFHQWELSVWEDGVLHFEEPTPLDDWDWEVRFDDPGVEVRLQGDSIDGLANGIVVSYTDFQGRDQLITPDDDARLLDTSEDNPANIVGIKKWIEPPGGKLGFPTTYEDAIQVGIAALGEAAQVKAPGEITVRGRIRDRRGNWQPVHKVRCGQRVRIANHPNDQPRRIIDTGYSGDEQKTLSISTDNTTKRVEGLFDRIDQARRAAGLG